MEYVLELNDIKKNYGGHQVLKGVNLRVKRGEIHALLGENGAGKSTLMNVLFGMPVIHSTGGFSGDILIEGKKADIKKPTTAIDYGIGMVHQEFMLIPAFTITENIKLNREILKENFLSKITRSDQLKTLFVQQMEKDSRAALDTIGIDISERVKIEGLPVGFMQFVEIAREIDKKNIKVLVFDEPTAVLTESEADTLLQSMRKLADSGISILFITHRLDEVMDVADEVTILRDGEWVTTKAKVDTNLKEMAELMVGRKDVIVSQKEDEKDQLDHDSIMVINNLEVDMPGESVKGISLDVQRGEILGIGGLAGQGKIGIANGIMGLFPTRGEVLFENKPLILNDTKASLNSKLAFVSEDRRGIGLLLDTSIEINIAITAMQANKKFIHDYKIFSLQDSKKIRIHALQMIKDLDIRCTGPLQITRRLSGGNQQKVCVARALTLNPSILFVSEPTRGIDIGAKKLVLNLLVSLNKEKNMTIVMTSSELAELRTVCDRIAIISEGKLEGILKPNASDADFGLMMSGEYKKLMAKRGQ